MLGFEITPKINVIFKSINFKSKFKFPNATLVMKKHKLFTFLPKISEDKIFGQVGKLNSKRNIGVVSILCAMKRKHHLSTLLF